MCKCAVSEKRVQSFYLTLKEVKEHKKIKNYQAKRYTISGSYFDCKSTESMTDVSVDTNLAPLVLMLHIYHTEQKFLLKRIKLKYSITVIP